jgi:hypothetical protein
MITSCQKIPEVRIVNKTEQNIEVLCGRHHHQLKPDESTDCRIDEDFKSLVIFTDERKLEYSFSSMPPDYVTPHGKKMIILEFRDDERLYIRASKGDAPGQPEGFPLVPIVGN